MKVITIDVRMLHSSGIGTYIRNLIPLIVESFPEIKFNLLGKISEINQYSWSKSKNINLIDCRSPIYSINEQLEMFRKVPRDTLLFWSPHYNIPLFYKGKMLVTVHDVAHLAMPDLVKGIHKRIYAKLMFKVLKYKASAIICDSHFTQMELNKQVGPDKQKVHTIHIGVDKSWFNVTKVQNPYSKPYLLYVGNVKPNKNLSGLLQAFEVTIDKYPQDLVILGKKEGFITGDEAVAKMAGRLGGRVHFTGFVEEDILKQYFAHADMLVFPSLYEGFGLPPLEAMASECPVVVSSAASLPEVCGDAALYCDPFNPMDIANKIEKLLNDKSYKDLIVKKGKEHAKKYTWEKCAKETIAIIKEVIAK
ncbi:glycosyltransferase family 4 protein [Paenibacillus sp. 2RAB27]|uniref:glycosyltransferase family 4 protein n=1 Tax=Paenibacillus sp. 2RAB27 TaxID=3232991 RepID=UPI003F975A8C